MSQKTIKIDTGIRIITLGSIAIAISTFVRQNNTQADTFLFILSGIFFLVSGSFYIAVNLLLAGDKNIINDVIEEQGDKLAFLPILFFKRKCLTFAASRIFCVIFLVGGISMFLVASVNLLDIFGNMRSLPTHLYWTFLLLMIISLFLSMFRPNIYKDFE